jgi:3-phosphoglycerate kinase
MNDGNHTSTSDPNEKAERRERLRQVIDSTKAPSMVDTLISLLLEAKEIIATHQGTLSFLAEENERLRQELEALQSALLTGRVSLPRPPSGKPN